MFINIASEEMKGPLGQFYEHRQEISVDIIQLQ